MIAAVPRERKGEKEKDVWQGWQPHASLAEPAAERQVLKHCNLDSLLAIVKTLAQSVEGLTGLKSLRDGAPVGGATLHSLLSTAGVKK